MIQKLTYPGIHDQLGPETRSVDPCIYQTICHEQLNMDSSAEMIQFGKSCWDFGISS